MIPLGYGVMLVLLTRVVHRHQTSWRGQLPKAMAYGAGWASMYTLPLVVAVALVHLILA